jgi:hypothetical protein
LYSTLLKFREYLRGYSEAAPYNNPQKIYVNSLTLGPEYAKHLKQLRKHCFIKTFHGSFNSTDEKIMEEAFEINDIGDVFNYYYLPFWKEECSDFEENSFIPLYQDEEALEEFRSVCAETLADIKTLRVISKEEVLSTFSSSSVFDPSKIRGSKFPTIKNYISNNKIEKRDFSDNIGTCLRCKIDLSAGNTRDTVILTQESLNSVRLIDLQVTEVLKSFPGFICNYKKEDLPKVLDEIYYNYTEFMDRDFQKEGLTKPRNILKIMLEELHKRFPEIECFSWVNFYENFSVYDHSKKETFFPDRGHGLGMANALTSLMQEILFRMVLSRTYSDSDGEINVDKLYVNDDITLAFTNLEDQCNWDNEEDIIFKKLGLLRKDKKSYYTTNGFCVAENYRPTSINKKYSYTLGNMFQATLYNIAMAKSLISSLINLEVETFNKYIKRIIQKVGFEFFPDEYMYPTRFGGWYNTRLGDFSLDLMRLSELPYTMNVIKAYHACKEDRPIRIRRRDKSNFVSIYEPYKDLIEDDLKIQFMIGSKFDIESHFHGFSRASDLEIRRLLEKRRRIYNKNYEYYTFESFCSYVVKDSKIDYFPLNFMIKDLYVSEKFYDKLNDCRSENSRRNYLERFNLPWYDDYSIRNNLGRRTIFTRNDFVRINTAGIPLPGFDKIYCETNNLVQRSFFTTHFPHFFMEMLGGLPILYDDFVNPMVKYKMNTLGKDFSSVDILHLGQKSDFSVIVLLIQQQVDYIRYFELEAEEKYPDEPFLVDESENTEDTDRVLNYWTTMRASYMQSDLKEIDSGSKTREELIKEELHQLHERVLALRVTDSADQDLPDYPVSQKIPFKRLAAGYMHRHVNRTAYQCTRRLNRFYLIMEEICPTLTEAISELDIDTAYDSLSETEKKDLDNVYINVIDSIVYNEDTFHIDVWTSLYWKYAIIKVNNWFKEYKSDDDCESDFGEPDWFTNDDG